MRRAGGFAVSADVKTLAISLFQTEPRDHPLGDHIICPVPAFFAERRWSAARTGRKPAPVFSTTGACDVSFQAQAKSAENRRCSRHNLQPVQFGKKPPLTIQLHAKPRRRSCRIQVLVYWVFPVAGEVCACQKNHVREAIKPRCFDPAVCLSSPCRVNGWDRSEQIHKHDHLGPNPGLGRPYRSA